MKLEGKTVTKMNNIDKLTAIVEKLQGLDWVEDAFVDDDCAPEGNLSIQINIKEEKIDSICKELGYNTEDWENEDE